MNTSITFTSLPLYCIKDKAADEFGPPFQAKTDAVALRMFNQLVEREKVTGIDYELYHVGAFDPVSGTLYSSSLRKIKTMEQLSELVKDVFPNAEVK